MFFKKKDALEFYMVNRRGEGAHLYGFNASGLGTFLHTYVRRVNYSKIIAITRMEFIESLDSLTDKWLCEGGFLWCNNYSQSMTANIFEDDPEFIERRSRRFSTFKELYGD